MIDDDVCSLPAGTPSQSHFNTLQKHEFGAVLNCNIEHASTSAAQQCNLSMSVDSAFV
jgi:hypothetical protein